MQIPFLRRLAEVNREIWLIASLLLVSGACNWLLSHHRMVLSFYTLPTVLSAWQFGKRHATLTAWASVFLVALLHMLHAPVLGVEQTNLNDWYETAVWGGCLVLTGYAIGSLHERDLRRLRELRDTYHGVLMILQQFISNDKYTQNHSWRVSVYATRIAAQMRLHQERIEDVRAASLLHDIGKLDIPREILYKAAKLTHEEFELMKSHVERGVNILEPVGGTLRRVLPIILSHHDRYDGQGYRPAKGEEIPLEARIIAVADTYDAITADRPYRKGRTPYEAYEIITERAGTEFDPDVVAAFDALFQRREFELPDLDIAAATGVGVH